MLKPPKITEQRKIFEQGGVGKKMFLGIFIFFIILLLNLNFEIFMEI